MLKKWHHLKNSWWSQSKARTKLSESWRTLKPRKEIFSNRRKRDCNKENMNWSNSLKRRTEKSTTLFKGTTRNLNNSSLRSGDSTKKKRIDLRDESLERNKDTKRKWIKLLKTTRIRSPKWQIIMRMPIMLLRKRSKQWRVICKTFSINSRRKIKWCNSKLKIRIDILLSLKIATITCKNKPADRVISSQINLEEKEKNSVRKSNNLQLKFPRETEPY